MTEPSVLTEQRSAAPRSAAFFDVDETLTTVKSMIAFLEYDWAAIGRPAADVEDAKRRLREVAARTSREEANRAYYRLYAGRSAAELVARGREWFGHELAGGGLFNPSVLGGFERHRRRGDLTVLVSGSFPACLDPIAAHIGAELTIGTMPEVVDGVYTGEVDVPMIGQAKAAAARRVLSAHRIEPRHSYAYADHESDLPLLREVGIPTMVGDDPVLLGHARREHWGRLPGGAGRRPAGHAVGHAAGHAVAGH